MTRIGANGGEFSRMRLRRWNELVQCPACVRLLCPFTPPLSSGVQYISACFSVFFLSFFPVQWKSSIPFFYPPRQTKHESGTNHLPVTKYGLTSEGTCFDQVRVTKTARPAASTQGIAFEANYIHLSSTFSSGHQRVKDDCNKLTPTKTLNQIQFVLTVIDRIIPVNVSPPATPRIMRSFILKCLTGDKFILFQQALSTGSINAFTGKPVGCFAL